MFQRLVLTALLLGAVGLIVACGMPNDGTPQAQAQTEAIRKAQANKPYVPENDLEIGNYNRRQRKADDPTTIMWCTSAFPIPSSPLFTVPVVGKLTSGNKRPYPTEQVRAGDGVNYFPELPGPDGMYGSSMDYRYGFTPIGMYVDWTGMPLFCTEEPTIWQREQTAIVM